MFISAVLASLALLGPAAISGQKDGFPTECPPDIENCIICSSKSFASGFALSQDAFVTIGSKFAAYICDGDTSINIATEVEDVAFAIAEAVATTSVDCIGRGDVVGSGTAVASAQAGATARAGALAEGFLSIETCNGCTAAIEAFAQSTETVFVEAIAESSSEIEEFVPLPLRDSATLIANFIVEFAEKLVPVYAGVIADVRVAAIPGEEMCNVTIATCTEAGFQDVCCVVTVDQAKQEIGENAYVELEALVTLGNESCNEPPGEDSVDVNAVAVATDKAFAESITKIFGFCAATTLSDACVWASGSIEAVAEAEAFALASATAQVSTCNCSIDVTALAESYQPVFVSAIAAAQVNACVFGEGVAAFDIVVRAVEEASVSALAAIFVKVYADCSVTECAFAETSVNGGTSAASCCVEAEPLIETYAADALAEASAEAVVATCTPLGEGAELVARSTASATALAEVAALAIAAFDVECESTDSYSYACGGGDVAIRATAAATARAYAQAWSLAVACGNCSVEVDTTIELVEDIYVEAVASVWGSVCTSGADKFDVEFYKEAYERDQLAVTAEAIASAAWYQDNGTCAAVGVACVGDDPNPAASTDSCCTGVLVSFSDNEADDVFAAVVAEATAVGFLCLPPSEAVARSTQFVTAIATAWAKAITLVVSDCTAPNNGKACFLAESSITASAEAFATILASTYAEAIGLCGCGASEEDLESATVSVLAEQTLAVLRDQCVDNGESFSESEFIEAVTSRSVEVFARAFAEAKVNFNNKGELECTATAEIEGGVLEAGPEQGLVQAPEAAPVQAPFAADEQLPAAAAAASDANTIDV